MIDTFFPVNDSYCFGLITRQWFRNFKLPHDLCPLNARYIQISARILHVLGPVDVQRLIVRNMLTFYHYRLHWGVRGSGRSSLWQNCHPTERPASYLQTCLSTAVTYI